MDFVVHPSPPKTASVSGGRVVNQRRRRAHQLSQSTSTVYTSAATRHGSQTVAAAAATASESTNGPTNWRTQRPSYLSQQLSRDLSTMLPDTDALGPISREMTVIDSHRGPRGWYVERCTHTLASGQEVLFAFSYPAIPCFFMDQAIPFQLDVIYPTFIEENSRLEASNLRLDLLRHIDSSSVGGKLCLERRNKVTGAKSDASMIALTDVECKDTSAAPADEYSTSGHTTNESCRSFKGKLQIHSGLRQAQEALSTSRSVRMDAMNQAKVQISTPADQITLPSFKFRGLSVEYTIGIELSLNQVSANGEDAAEALPSIQAVVETSQIQLQSLSSSTAQLQIGSRGPSAPTSIIVSQHEATSSVSAIEGEAAPDGRRSEDLFLRRSLSPLPSHQEAPASNEGHVDIHPSASTTANVDVKHPSHHEEEEQPTEAVEYLFQSAAVPTFRGRSATNASQFSAQTMDGLPPPYCSPSLFESRRL
jgi:hypothetical protein